MPVSKAPYKRGYKHTKSRGSDPAVWCEMCGRRVPRFKSFSKIQSFYIADPVVRGVVDQHSFNVRKVYYCPKCAKFLGIVEKKRQRMEQPKRIPEVSGNVIIRKIHGPEVMFKHKDYAFIIDVENKKERIKNLIIRPKTIVQNINLEPKEVRFDVPEKTIKQIHFRARVDDEVTIKGTAISFEILKDGRPLENKVHYVSIMDESALNKEIKLEIEKRLERTKITANEMLKVELVVKNTGDYPAYFEIKDKVPKGWLTRGDTRVHSYLQPKEELVHVYQMKPFKAGKYRIPRCEMMYEDDLEVKRVLSNEVTVEVLPAKKASKVPLE
ncbi:MAG: hypothetical protein ACE5K4_08985 [Candidatus Hydrothermarchaeota archaeon]